MVLVYLHSIHSRSGNFPANESSIFFHHSFLAKPVCAAAPLYNELYRKFLPMKNLSAAIQSPKNTGYTISSIVRN